MTAPRMSTGDAVVAHVVSLALTGAVMWILHTGDHSPLVVLAVGIGVYAGVLGGMLAIGRARARRRSERERENFNAFVAERNRRLYGHD